MSKGVRRAARSWCTPCQQHLHSQSGAGAPHSTTLARWTESPQFWSAPHQRRLHSNMRVCSRGLLLTLALLFCLIGSVSAHEIRPAYLELHEEQPDEFNVLWKTPMRGEMRLALEPEFSGHMENLTPIATRQTGSAAVQTWRLRAIDTLHGQAIRIRGLESTLTDALVRIEFTDGSAWVKRLTPQEPRATIPERQNGWSVAGLYLKLGIEHILLGIDHLLFVFSLLLITQGTWLLVKTVTAFTVAHSVTLALATLGVVQVPSAPVEAVIALSIVFVAAEIVHTHKGREGVTVRQPWVVAFVFGLLHGFGFAGALSEVGLPQSHIPLALLFFNLGVEMGQLFFITAVLALGALVQWGKIPMPRWVESMPPYAIGSLAMFWVIQRIAAF